LGWAMRRRDFIKLIGGTAAAWPLAVRAQQKGGKPHIGVLLGLADGHPETRSRVKGFQKGLRDRGWVGGQNIRGDYRFAGSDPNRIREYTAELVRLTPDLIVANSTPVLSALRRATSTIPIVFAVVNDPVGQGFVSSAAHPGGNVTGFSFIEPDLVGKWVTMLKDVAPKIFRANLMFNPATAPYYDLYLRSIEAVPQTTKVDVTALAARQ